MTKFCKSFFFFFWSVTSHSYCWGNWALLAFVASTNTGLKGDSCKAPFRMDEIHFEHTTVTYTFTTDISPTHKPLAWS